MSSGKAVAMIGLGNMGSGMLANLCKAGHRVTAFDLSSSALQYAQRCGAVPASSPREAAHEADVVLTMLPAATHVRQVYLDPSTGVLAGAVQNALFIDCSTIDPGTAKEIAVTSKKSSIQARFLDAPVSGGVSGAEKGTLTFLVGGAASDLDEARPVLEAMGQRVLHCGGLGTGQAAKLANNSILAASMVAVSEAMILGQRLGVDSKVLSEVINSSSGRCWSSEVYCPVPGVQEGVPSSRDYVGGFGTALMLKDLGLALEAAREEKAAVPLCSLTHSLYSMIHQHGHGEKDFSYVYRFLQGKKTE